jgi:hypothetical protein
MNNEPRGLLPTTAFVSRNNNWIFNFYTMKKRNEEREYYAAIGTMILVTVISITLVIALISNI